MALSVFLRNEPLSFSGCLPRTMELATKCKILVMPLIDQTPSQFAYEDRVLVCLLPNLKSAAAAFYDGDGPTLTTMLRPHVLEHLDTVLRDELLTRL